MKFEVVSRREWREFVSWLRGGGGAKRAESRGGLVAGETRKPEEERPAVTKEPIIIAHGTNSINKLCKAMQLKANAVEVDVRGPEPLVLDHNFNGPWSQRLRPWLEFARNFAAGGHLKAIIFDVKTPKALKALHDAVVEAEMPSMLQMVFSVSSLRRSKYLEDILPALQENHAIAVDYHNDPAIIQEKFKGHNIWFGNGIFKLEASSVIAPRALPSLRRAVEERDAGKGIRKVYAWTTSSRSLYRTLLNDYRVDGVIVETSLLAKLAKENARQEEALNAFLQVPPSEVTIAS